MNESQTLYPMPTAQDILKARKVFKEKEPRDLFYRVATEMMSLATQRKTQFSVSEALAVLLQTWNKRYYNKHRPFDNQHFSDLERIVHRNQLTLASFKDRTIETFSENDKVEIKRIFEDFDKVIGPVGAAKSLHLFVPNFFPIWDSIIAEKYHLPLMYGLKTEKHIFNAERYIHFMMITASQYKILAQESTDSDLLKAIDEYNYCKFSRKWL
jgi:hypothetical protein